MKTNKENHTQNNKYQTKQKPHRKHWVSFVLANYSWTWGLPWNVIAITSVTPLKKTDFHLPSSQQLQTAYCIGVELHTTSPSPSSGFSLVWTCSGLVYSVRWPYFITFNSLSCPGNVKICPLVAKDE